MAPKSPPSKKAAALSKATAPSGKASAAGKASANATATTALATAVKPKPTKPKWARQIKAFVTLTGPFNINFLIPFFMTLGAVVEEGAGVVRPCFAITLFPLQGLPDAVAFFSKQREAVMFATMLLALATACLVGGIPLLRSALAAIDATGGTIAPDDPPPTLVTSGPYGYIRNPMALAQLLILVAEASLIGVPKLVWLVGLYAAFLLIYTWYFEEPALRKRFGPAWVHYEYNVGAWIPRLTPWNPAREQV